MSNNRRYLIAGGIVAALAATSGAFTASLDTTADSTDVVSAGTVSTSGATVLDIAYKSDAAATDLESVTVLFGGAYTPETEFTLSIGGTPFTADAQTPVAGDTQVTFTPQVAVPLADISQTNIAVVGDVAVP